GAITLEIELEMIVISSEMTHDSCGRTGIYNDTMNISLTEESVSSGGGISSYQRNKNIAEDLFKDEESIGKIDLVIKEKISGNNSYLVGWSDLRGYNHIKYELLYSTGSTFKEYKSFDVNNYSKNFFYKDLDTNSLIYFFKVRAYYNDKYSNWSNVLSITNKDSLLRLFKIKCVNCNDTISFMDVFKTPDLLLEDKFKVKCIGCTKKVGFYDIFQKKETILDKFKTICINCTKKVNFSDLVK
ncbi:MAG: hypothetical protein QM490_00945, partial [Candidatus Gracilibacteria bacterium]